MYKHFLILFLGLSFLFQVSHAEAATGLDELLAEYETEGGRYIWMSSDESFSTWFDKDTIKFSRNYNGINTQVVDVWTKFTYSQKGVTEEIQFRTKHKLEVEGYENLNKTMYHYLFDIKSSSLKILGSTAYDWKGKVLDSYYLPEHQVSWITIIPGSNGELWLKAIKNYSLQNETILKQRS